MKVSMDSARGQIDRQAALLFAHYLIDHLDKGGIILHVCEIPLLNKTIIIKYAHCYSI